jgi:hypothetical protein
MQAFGKTVGSRNPKARNLGGRWEESRFDWFSQPGYWPPTTLIGQKSGSSVSLSLFLDYPLFTTVSPLLPRLTPISSNKA